VSAQKYSIERLLYDCHQLSHITYHGPYKSISEMRQLLKTLNNGTARDKEVEKYCQILCKEILSSNRGLSVLSTGMDVIGIYA
jgi:hypothetical protein